MSEVWISYYIDYPDQRGDDGWWATERDAVEGIKQRYAPPYIVEWKEKRDKQGLLILSGYFEAVQGKSTKHDAHWEIRREPIVAVIEGRA